MTAALAVGRPWLRLGSFLGLAALFMLIFLVFGAIVLEVLPGLRVVTITGGPLPDRVDRLVYEGYQAIWIGVLLALTALAFLAAAAISHQRRLRDFLWPDRRMNAGHFWIGLATVGGICLVQLGVPLVSGERWVPPIADPDYLASTRAPYAVMIVIGFFLAAGAEEVFCRGVLLRLSAQITRRPLILCLLNGLAFSTLHLDPDPVAFVARAMTGVVWTWAAIRLGGLEFATGAHLAGNLVLVLLAAPPSEFSAPTDSTWVRLIPEVLIAAVTVSVIERLAREPRRHPVGREATEQNVT